MMLIVDWGNACQPFNWDMIGTAMGSPTFSTPWAKNILPLTRPLSKCPIDFGISVIAFSGQTKVQLPQPWQSSGKTSVFPPNVTMAWN